MSEWQPARFRRVHDRRLLAKWKPSGAQEIKEVIHVRETSWIHPITRGYFQTLGCSGERFYDCLEYPHHVWCEHEILTD
jgi:hypothetical protein